MKLSGTLKVKTWYGLSTTVKLFGTAWASIGPLPPHPQLVNIVLRIGLSRENSVHLQLLHETGHLQTLPILIVPVVLFYYLSLPLFPAVIGLLVISEILAEFYVMAKEGKNYFRIYGSLWR
ncbi:MAG: hypothetical protein ACC640_01395 [bacterium]